MGRLGAGEGERCSKVIPKGKVMSKMPHAKVKA